MNINVEKCPMSYIKALKSNKPIIRCKPKIDKIDKIDNMNKILRGPPALRHKFWCMIIPNICDLSSYLELAKTCKYFQKMIKRYLWCTQMDCNGAVTFYNGIWTFNEYHTWAGQFFDTRDDPISRCYKNTGHEEYSYKSIVLSLKEDVKYLQEHLLLICYKGQIRRYCVPSIDG